MRVHELDVRLVLVCGARRPEGSRPSCGAAGRTLLALLRDELEQRNTAEEIVAVPSGCLGGCEASPVVVDASGRGRVYSEVAIEEVGDLVDRLTSVPEDDSWISTT